ncbi:PAAR domain-containing protein [Paraburkholderia sp. BCC1876]|uniref:PAAR domain-containing protein n=1 Tax=Paraburkholderia sp. BCC1876 TaxID=2676303 RepID=UPI0015902026|nr:PAAR domain-containing protein [Paraburkholderia sp. BCC1876]
MKNVVRVGDPTSHGGEVTSGASRFMVDGLPVARVGDTCTCPKDGHDDCTIAEGDPNFVIEGRAVAFDGHKTTCGAMLRSTVTNFGGA